MKPFRIVAFILLLIGVPTFAQTDPMANQLLHNIYSKLQKAHDYSVQAHIKVDMPFIRMLPIDATIYFKQKNKFKVESKSIAIVPRQGFDQASKMLADTNAFTALVQGTELIGNVQASVVNIIPVADTSDLILGKLWVDKQRQLILKSKLTSRANGTIVTEYTYGNQAQYALPDKMIFSVDVKKFKLPAGTTGDMNANAKKTTDKPKDDKKGQITITLSNYQINKGIPDEFFKKK
jgi:outer membrane lipoprotein-sorting protein